MKILKKFLITIWPNLTIILILLTIDAHSFSLRKIVLGGDASSISPWPLLYMLSQKFRWCKTHETSVVKLGGDNAPCLTSSRPHDWKVIGRNK